MQLISEPKYSSPEDYLKLEETAEYKSEYRDGKIIPMTGGCLLYTSPSPRDS